MVILISHFFPTFDWQTKLFMETSMDRVTNNEIKYVTEALPTSSWSDYYLYIFLEMCRLNCMCVLHYIELLIDILIHYHKGIQTHVANYFLYWYIQQLFSQYINCFVPRVSAKNINSLSYEPRVYNNIWQHNDTLCHGKQGKNNDQSDLKEYDVPKVGNSFSID